MALDRPPRGLAPELARYLEAIRAEIAKTQAASKSGTSVTIDGQSSRILTATTQAGSAASTKSVSPASKLFNLQAFAGLEVIILTWQGTNQASYAYTEIWRNNIDDLSSAQLINPPAVVGVASDNVGANASYFYWVRAVNTAGQPGPFNQQAGTPCQTSPGTEFILAQLVGAITESQLYVDLQTKIDDSYTGVVTNTTAIAGLDAQYTVKVDVDGYVSGFGLANTLKNAAPFSEFIILADSFAVVFPAQTWAASAGAALGEYIKPTALPTGLYYKVITAGTLGVSEPTWPTIAGDTVTSGTAVLKAVTIESSVPFVVGQVGGVSTVGVDGSLVVDGSIVANAIAAGTITADKLNVAQLSAVAATLGTVVGGTFATGSNPAMRTEISSTGTYLIWAGSGATGGAGAVFYIDNAGNAFFKGTLDAGVISASVLSPGGLLIDCGGGLTTTFVITSTDNKTFYRAKQGTAGAITLDLGTYYGPTHGTGYYSGRFAFQCMDVSIDFQIDGDWGDVTAKVDVQYDAGAWQNIYSFKTDCDYRGGASGSLIYTTKNTAWGTMAVRVTTDGNTQSASGRVTVINLAASTQTPDTVHNTTGDTSDPGVVRTLDNVPNGTTYGKALAARLNAGKPWIDFSEGIHANKNASNIPYVSGASIESLKPTAAGATPNVYGTQNIVPNPAPRFAGDTYGWCTASANETITSHMYASPSPYAPVVGYFQLDYVDNGRAYASYDGVNPAKFQCNGGEHFYIEGNFDGASAANIQLFLIFRRADGTSASVANYETPAGIGGSWNIGIKANTIPNDCAYFYIMMWSDATAGQSMYWTNIVVGHGSRALTKAGSGIQLGDARNGRNSFISGLSAATSNGPVSSTSGASSATASINAHTVTLGNGETVSYTGVTNFATGLPISSNRFAYTTDSNFAGGTATWHDTSSSYTAQNNSDGPVYAYSTPPASTGGGGSGSGLSCVDIESRLPDGRRAGDLKKGDRVQDAAGRWHEIINDPEIVERPCLLIVAKNGCLLICSNGTPFTVDSRCVWAPEMLGESVHTSHGQSIVAEVLGLGPRKVIHLNLGGHSFCAGVTEDLWVESHNVYKQ